MSIFLAHRSNATTAQTVSSSVRDKGLSLLKAKPCDVQVSVLSYAVQPGYASYTKNLPAFMEATTSKTTVLISNRGYPITTVDTELPWVMPSLIYDFGRRLSDGKQESLKAHSVLVMGRGGPSFVMKEPTLEKVRQLVANESPNAKTAHLINTVNLDALKVLFMLRRLFSAFMLTHVYPAFRHMEDFNPTQYDQTVHVSNKRRKTDQTTYLQCITDTHGNLEDPMNVDSSKDDVIPLPSPQEIQLTYAKPAPDTGDRWGPIANIPNASGLYFPFVKELAIADTTTVPELISSTFLRSLASDMNGMFQTMDSIRKAWGVIATTELGHEISHQAKCITIALQAQAIVYPVYTSGIYEGTVVSGAGYGINVKEEVYRPIAYADLKEEVTKNSSHAKALAVIAEAVGEGVNVADVETMRELSNLVKGVEMDGMTRKTVVEAAHNLGYANKYWSSSVAFVDKALALLLDKDSDIGVDVPMHPSYLFTTDRVEEVLCAFGHQAPTFMIANAPMCKLSVDEPPKNFHVRTVATSIAVSDLKFVRENGFISNNLQNLSSKHRDTPIKGPTKSKVWKMLKVYHESAIEGDATSAANRVGPSQGTNALDLW